MVSPLFGLCCMHSLGIWLEPLRSHSSGAQGVKAAATFFPLLLNSAGSGEGGEGQTATAFTGLLSRAKAGASVRSHPILVSAELTAHSTHPLLPQQEGLWHKQPYVPPEDSAMQRETSAGHLG